MKKTMWMAGMLLALAVGAPDAAEAMTGKQADPMAVGDAIGIDFGPIAHANNFNVLATSLQRFTQGNSLAETNRSLTNLSGTVMDGVSVILRATGYFSNDDADDDIGSPPGVYSSESLTDWIGVVARKGGALTVTFKGLNDSFLYDLNIGTAFKKNKLVNGTIYSADGQSAENSNTARDPNFFDLKGLSTDGGGNLVITVSGAAAPSVSALTLKAVPEAVAVSRVVSDAERSAFANLRRRDYGGQEASADNPNFVLIFTDDQGYADLSCFGGTHVSTPRIDKMADEGARLTSFYVAAPLCTPSRAGLMSGCYPKRIDMAYGSDFAVLLAADRKGMNPDEITIAEVLKSAGYATGMFGKWHLGDQPEFLPTRQGFDEYFGIPYSHDIHPFHPRQKHFKFPPLPLLDGETVVEMDPDADYLTRRITERAVSFIEANRDKPFFLYVPHPIPHGPLHASPPFMAGVPEAIKAKLEREKGVDYGTRTRLFRPAISEIDWSVGQILDTLKQNGLDESTVVIFTSDNGPATGKATPLRGKKGSTFEGGMREPTVIRWPGRIPAGVVNDELMTAMDLLPTFAKLAGAEVPSDRVIDGKDIWPVLTQNARSPHEVFFYYRDNDLKAVRSGKWKLHLALPQGKGTKGTPKSALYDLEADIGETTNVLAENPEVAERLRAYVSAFKENLAQNSRPAAFVDDPKPLAKPTE
jgi:arylsulfatase A